MCCPLVFEFSVGIGGFVIGLGQISFFFSQYQKRSLTYRMPPFDQLSKNKVLLLYLKIVLFHIGSCSISFEE